MQLKSKKGEKKLTKKTQPAPDEKPFKCDLCGDTFRAPTALGMHKSQKHGIAGTSHAAISARKAKAAAAAQPTPPTPPPPPPPKKIGRPKGSKTQKRSTQLATTIQNGHQANGYHPEETYSPFSATETAVAFAFGRYTALCAEVAREFELPEKLLARELRAFIARAR